MLIFIDESGIHRQTGCSVIALICVANVVTLAKLDKQVEKLEKAIGTTSFHWAGKGWPFRRDFVAGLVDLEFSVRLVQLDNPIKLEEALEETLLYLIPERNIERLFIDGKKHKKYARALKKLLRDKGITVRKVKTVNDEAYPTIRIADAVAGTVRYYADNPTKRAKELYKVLEPKIEFIHIQK